MTFSKHLFPSRKTSENYFFFEDLLDYMIFEEQVKVSMKWHALSSSKPMFPSRKTFENYFFCEELLDYMMFEEKGRFSMK